MKAKQRKDAAVLKELPKVKRSLNRFSQVAVDSARGDLSNMALAFLAGLERAAQEVPEDSTPKSRGRREESTVES